MLWFYVLVFLPAVLFFLALFILTHWPEGPPRMVDSRTGTDPRREIRHIERNAQRAMRIRTQEFHREFNATIARHRHEQRRTR